MSLLFSAFYANCPCYLVLCLLVSLICKTPFPHENPRYAEGGKVYELRNDYAKNGAFRDLKLMHFAAGWRMFLGKPYSALRIKLQVDLSCFEY